jgi:hypothetical protein
VEVALKSYPKYVHGGCVAGLELRVCEYPTYARGFLKADMMNPDERKSVANTVKRIIDALNKVTERCR